MNTRFVYMFAGVAVSSTIVSLVRSDWPAAFWATMAASYAIGFAIAMERNRK